MHSGHDGEGITHLVVIEITGVAAQIVQIFSNMAAILFVTMTTGGLMEKSPIYFLLPMTYSFLLAI